MVVPIDFVLQNRHYYDLTHMELQKIREEFMKAGYQRKQAKGTCEEVYRHAKSKNLFRVWLNVEGTEAASRKNSETLWRNGNAFYRLKSPMEPTESGSSSADGVKPALEKKTTPISPVNYSAFNKSDAAKYSGFNRSGSACSDQTTASNTNSGTQPRYWVQLLLNRPIRHEALLHMVLARLPVPSENGQAVASFFPKGSGKGPGPVWEKRIYRRVPSLGKNSSKDNDVVQDDYGASGDDSLNLREERAESKGPDNIPEECGISDDALADWYNEDFDDAVSSLGNIPGRMRIDSDDDGSQFSPTSPGGSNVIRMV